jgi:large subunit ribosomal protein L14
MIYKTTVIPIVDNSGAKFCYCIGFYGSKKQGRLGDIIKVSLKTVKSNKNLSKGELARILLIRTKQFIERANGQRIKLGKTGAILLKKGDLPKGKRIYGPVLKELRTDRLMKVMSLAPLIL